MTMDLIASRERPPRCTGGDNWARRLRIGFLIDWLDSRPEHTAEDSRRLRARAERGDEVALAAAGITSRLGRVPYAGELMFDSRTDHGLEYAAHSGVWYHAHIAGHLHDDERAGAEAVYTKLHTVAPDCLSALANLAELERRRGRETVALALLETAHSRAESSSTRRHDVPDRNWILPIRCAIARMMHAVGEGQSLLDCATRGHLAELLARLRAFDSLDEATVAAHQAFSVASAEQRLVLHTAMRLSPTMVQPPPAAHGRFEAIDVVEALVVQYSRDDAKHRQHTPMRTPAITTAGTPGRLGSAILRLLRRRRNK